jgi:hypothetical protein
MRSRGRFRGNALTRRPAPAPAVSGRRRTYWPCPKSTSGHLVAACESADEDRGETQLLPGRRDSGWRRGGTAPVGPLGGLGPGRFIGKFQVWRSPLESDLNVAGYAAGVRPDPCLLLMQGDANLARPIVGVLAGFLAILKAPPMAGDKRSAVADPGADGLKVAGPWPFARYGPSRWVGPRA